MYIIRSMFREGYIRIGVCAFVGLERKGFCGNQIFGTKKDFHSSFPVTLLSSFPDKTVGPGSDGGRGEVMSNGNVFLFFLRPAPNLFCSFLGPLHASHRLLEHGAFPQS